MQASEHRLSNTEKQGPLSIGVRFTFFVFAFLILIPATFAQNTTVAYVSSMRGKTLSSEQITPIKRWDTLTAQDHDLTIKDGFLILVFSNGLSIYCGPKSSLTLKKATQSRFLSQDDLKYEPSRSNIEIHLKKGEFAFAQRIPNPTSQLTVTTPHGSLNCKSRSFYISLAETKPRAYVFEGGIRANLKKRNNSDLTQAGQVLHLDATATTLNTDTIQRTRNPEEEHYLTFVKQASIQGERIFWTEVEGNAYTAKILLPEEHFERRPKVDYKIRSR